MNTLPEWFTVESKASYMVERGEENPRVYAGSQLYAGETLEICINPVRSRERSDSGTTPFTPEPKSLVTKEAYDEF